MKLKVFKFGGASVKDAGSVKNVVSVLKQFPNQKIVVVVSAMGKTTNALEKLTDDFVLKNGNAKTILEEIKKYHFDIIGNLFSNSTHPIYSEVKNIFSDLEIKTNKLSSDSYNKEYDQIVSQGEIVATKIVRAYLNEVGIKNNWLDIREVIKTDSTFREGKVNWELTEKLVGILNPNQQITITQGFLGCTPDNFTTTLGREGSDYTASILAYCTNAESVTIWKDVPGVMNADPKWFDETKLIDQMSYQDAIELAYYGATVIHPKTIKPLQNKRIPLYVKSFLQPEKKGTVINDQHSQLPIPCLFLR